MKIELTSEQIELIKKEIEATKNTSEETDNWERMFYIDYIQVLEELVNRGYINTHQLA